MLPSEVCIGNETTEQAQHERSSKKISDCVGRGSISQMHRPGQVGDQIDSNAKSCEPLTSLNPFKSNQEGKNTDEHSRSSNKKKEEER